MEKNLNVVNLIHAIGSDYPVDEVLRWAASVCYLEYSEVVKSKNCTPSTDDGLLILARKFSEELLNRQDSRKRRTRLKLVK